MNPNDFEIYDAPGSGSIAARWICKGCGTDRFCQCTVLETTGPFGCPCGGHPEWRLLVR